MKICPKCLIGLVVVLVVLYFVWKKYGKQLTTKAASMAALDAKGNPAR